MKRQFFYMVIIAAALLGGCRSDETYKQTDPSGAGYKSIELALTGRIGSVVGDSLTQYVKSLNLLLFRENESGDYVLFRNRLLTKNNLESLGNAGGDTDAGFTVRKLFTFDTLPIANYRIVGVANVSDSLGNTQPSVSLRGVESGNTMAQVLVAVRDGSESPRLFLGMTDVVRAGATASNPPVLTLVRKVAMFAITLKEVPDVVDRIDMEIDNTYGSFRVDGNYIPGNAIRVNGFSSYIPQDSALRTYVTLPTVVGDSSRFVITFYLKDAEKQVVTLPRYVLKPNTITKVTATVDTDQPGNVWKVNVDLLLTVDVEWNVEQEPPVVI